MTVGRRCDWADDLDTLAAIERNLSEAQLAAVREIAELAGYDLDEWLRCQAVRVFCATAARNALDRRLEEEVPQPRAERETAWELRVPESTVRSWLRRLKQ